MKKYTMEVPQFDALKGVEPQKYLSDRIIEIASKYSRELAHWETYDAFYSELLNLLEWLHQNISMYLIEELDKAISEIELMASNVGGMNSPRQMMYNAKLRIIKESMYAIHNVNITAIIEETPILTVRKINADHRDELLPMSWHYAHGELQDIAEYDIMAYYKSQKDIVEPMIGTGVYDVLVKVERDGTMFECTLFSWKSTNNFNKGLIVKKGDTVYYEDAKSKFESRADTI